MNKTFVIILTFFSIVFGWICSDIYRSRTIHPLQNISDTIIVHDTIERPICKDSSIIGYQYIRIPYNNIVYSTDTIYHDSIVHDSISVMLPVEQKIYEDSTYKAVISGFKPQLDSMIIKSKIITNTRLQYVTKKTRFGIGIQSGYGFGRNGLNPYIGIGLQYNIYSW